MSLLNRLDNQKSTQENTENSQGAESADQYLHVNKKIHSDIIDSINKRGRTGVDREEMRKLIQEAVQLEENGIPRLDRVRVAAEIFNDVLGYGPIEELLDNPEYSEVMVNGPGQVYVESKGKLILTGITFRDEAHVINIIDRIVSQIGRHVGESSPMVAARLPDGSRVNAIIPPLSLVGPVLTIRKFGKTALTAKNLIVFGSLSPKM